MRANNLLRYAMLIGILLNLPSCQAIKPTDAPAVVPEVLFTSVALTATAQPTATSPQPTRSPTPLPIPAKPTPLPVSGLPGDGSDRAEFVEDITIPDGMSLPAGQSFVKTWRLKNSGTSTWNKAYRLGYYGGEAMGSPQTINLPTEVRPGETVELSLELIAPAQTGPQRGLWIFLNSSGQLFGVGATFNEPIWVDILVENSEVENNTQTPEARTAQVDLVELEIDDSLATACPHQFTFTAKFRLDLPGEVAFNLKAGDALSPALIDFPSPAKVSLTAGLHNVQFLLNFTDSITGWAQFIITYPNQVSSSSVSFRLTCP